MIEIISSKENILLAYRNIKRNEKAKILCRISHNKYILNNHLNIFNKLVKYRDKAIKENQILELYFNKLSVKYGTMCMAEGVKGGDEIMLCTDYDNDTEYKVITLLLKDNKTYKIEKFKGKGYFLELIEK